MIEIMSAIAKGIKEVASKSIEAAKHFDPDAKAEVSPKEIKSKNLKEFDPDAKAEISKSPVELLKEQNPNGLEARKTYEINEHKIETDDNGNPYVQDNKLLPNNEYELNNINYKTDNNGNKSGWEGKITPEKYNPENARDKKAQMESGGQYRLYGDEGGHLVSRTLSGDSGIGNLEPMRAKINRGDYKVLENEISNVVKNGQEVFDKGTIFRDDIKTFRPTKFEREISYGDTKKILKCDNVEGSTDLLNEVKGRIDDVDYRSLENRIKDMKNDGNKVSVTSTLENLNENKIKFVIRNETTGNSYSSFINIIRR